MSKKKTLEEFKIEMHELAPSIQVIGDYINARTPIKCKCSICGHTWNATPTNLLRGTGCPKCAGRLRIPKEVFLKRLSHISPTIKVTGDYINMHTYLSCRCEVCGYSWNPTPTNLMRGSGCPKCSKVYRRTETEYIEELRAVNPTIRLIGPFTNMSTKVKCECKNCGHIWDTNPYTLLRGNGCPECAIERIKKKSRRSHEDFIKQLQIINPNIEILEQYTNSATKVKARCKKCGHEWEVVPNSLIQGTGCPICAGNVQKTHTQFEHDLREVNPNIILRGEYVNAHTGIECECSLCGHIWKTKPNNLLNGQGCPNCNKRNHTSFGEQAVYYYIKQFFPDAISSYKDLGYELDIFIPSISTGIEYDGEYWHKNKLKSDIEKDQRCKRDGIHLIRIRESGLAQTPTAENVILEDRWNDEALNDCIHSLLKIIGIDSTVDTANDRQLIMSQYYTRLESKTLQSEFPQIAEEWHTGKNGNLIPDMFTPKSGKKVWWKCNVCGHEWEAKIIERTRGNGCPECGKRRRIKKQTKTHDQFLEELGQINNSVVVLGKYINTNTNILCRCTVCGYEWSPRPSKLLKGQGCPKCAGKVTKTTAEFANELKNVNPNVEVIGEYEGSTKKIKIKCKICGHEWEATPSNLLYGYGYPKCAVVRNHNKTRLTHDEFLKRIQQKGNPNVIITGKYVNAKTKVGCRCNVCGHEWEATPNSLYQGHGCPKCQRRKSHSV